MTRGVSIVPVSRTDPYVHSPFKITRLVARRGRFHFISKEDPHKALDPRNQATKRNKFSVLSYRLVLSPS